jgi:dTMP kinase
MFVTLEGPEGGGKSTQASLLAAYLRERGRDVVSVREPGGTPLGEAVRDLLLDPRHEIDVRTEMLLFAASRAQLVARVIAPALEAGRDVVCDRYVDASLAYQGVGRGLGVAVVREVNAVATGGLVPDLTLLLDIDPAAGLRRARAETAAGGGPDAPHGDRLERERLAFHERVREGFLALAKKEPRRIRIIDARGSIAEVRRAVQEAVAQALERRGEGPGEGGAR